jgi:hypothetical protein
MFAILAQSAGRWRALNAVPDYAFQSCETCHSAPLVLLNIVAVNFAWLEICRSKRPNAKHFYNGSQPSSAGAHPSVKA